MAKKTTAAARPKTAEAAKESERGTDADVESASAQVEAAREQLRAAEELLEQAREKVVERGAWLRDKTTGELLDGSLDFVRKNPGLGVLAAAAAGYFVGRLWTSLFRR